MKFQNFEKSVMLQDSPGGFIVVYTSGIDHCATIKTSIKYLRREWNREP